MQLVNSNKDMSVNLDKYYQKCVTAGLCEKGKEYWDNKEQLISFAKQECEFLIENKPLTHNEMLEMFSQEYLNTQSVYIKQNLDTLIESEDVYSLILNCTGIIRIFEDSSIINVADNSNIQVRIFADGLCTLRLFTNSKIDIILENNCGVMVFNYGGEVKSVQGNPAFVRNVTIKNFSK